MSRKSKIMIIIFVLVFTFGLLFIVNYFLSSALEGVELKEVDIDEIDSLEIAKDADELIQDSDLIVLGTYAGLNKTVNLFENILPSPYEDEQIYMLGRLFQFHIDDVLKGDIDRDSIDIVHIYSLPFKTEEVLGKVDDDAQAPDPTYISPGTKNQYVAFLKTTEKSNVYQRSMEPFLFELDPETDKLQVKSKILEQIDFQSQVLDGTLADLKNQLEEEG